MILRLLYALALWLDPGVQLRAPDCTIHERAAEHVAAARAVGVLYDLDPALLLAMARHESCFDNRVVTGKCSGVMQTMGARPRTLLEGYERGAQEIRAWQDVSGKDLRLALSGYSGGWVVWRACRRSGGRDVVRQGNVGPCGFADVFLRWARRMRHGLV